MVKDKKNMVLLFHVL